MNNQPIRILHVIGTMHFGGAETMLMNFYRNIDRTKVQFDFVENQGMEANFDQEILSLGGKIYRCPRYRGKNHLKYIAWWKSFLAEHAQEYSAVHGHIGSTASIYLYLAKKAGLYTIAHSHNTANFSLKSVIYQAYACPTRYIADFFFGCSRDAGVSRYGKRICSDSARFRVLNNAIDTAQFSYNEALRKAMRSHLGISDKCVIGHVGRFVDQKNHTFLVEIFREVHRMDPNTVLLLIGDGELRCQVEEQVIQAGLKDCVIFAGAQKNVSDYYQAMDLFILPSLFEGLGIVAVEAQSSGLPCIISDTVSQECIVTDGLVSVKRLTDSAESWAVHILQQAELPRKDRTDAVKRSGYDIRETAKWLEKFYLEIGAAAHGLQ